MHGETVHMRLFDLGGELRVSGVRSLLGNVPRPAPLVSQSPAPPSATFPEPLETVQELAGVAGGKIEVRLHSMGVVVVRFRVPTATRSLAEIDASVRVLPNDRAVDELANELFQRVRIEIADAVAAPYVTAVTPERYTVFCPSVRIEAPPKLSADERKELARIVSEDARAASVPERVDNALRHVVQASAADLVAIGWDNAVVLGHTDGYEDVLDVMELANLELLEFRTYDAALDEKLEASFQHLDRLWASGGLFRSARSALRQLSALRVDFARLTDNLHDTGKIFGDWYVAKLHQHLHERFHLASWQRAVASKMATLEDMYHLAQEETNHRRSLVLEILVVLLFVLDLVILVRI